MKQLVQYLLAGVGVATVMLIASTPLQTKVVTRNGVVTLSGVAKNASEKSLVTSLVEDVHGVTSVKNEMSVQ